MRANNSGLKVASTHQHGGCTSPVARSISIAQRLSPPHKGQRAGSGVTESTGGNIGAVYDASVMNAAVD